MKASSRIRKTHRKRKRKNPNFQRHNADEGITDSNTERICKEKHGQKTAQINEGEKRTRKKVAKKCENWNP